MSENLQTCGDYGHCKNEDYISDLEAQLELARRLAKDWEGHSIGLESELTALEHAIADLKDTNTSLENELHDERAGRALLSQATDRIAELENQLREVSQ